MEEFILEATEKSPAIHLKDGLITISGRSIPEDPDRFYRPAVQWVMQYIKNPALFTEVSFQIEYCDTKSTVNIYDILTRLVKCRNSNLSIQMVFNWYYEKDDEEIIDLGRFLESKLNVMFNYIEIEI